MKIPSDIRIKENSFLARIARLVLKSENVAMVFHNTILLSGVKKVDFLSNAEWVRHELVHVKQYKKHGLLAFIIKYLIESVKNGYYNNRYEVEAREEARKSRSSFIDDQDNI